MSLSRAFDLAQWVGTPVNIGDGVVVSALGPPFQGIFKPVVTSPGPGVVVSSSVPSATAQGQSLLSGPGPGYAWSVVTDSAASASVPPPTATGQVLASDATPSWQVSSMTGSVFVQVSGRVHAGVGGPLLGGGQADFHHDGVRQCLHRRRRPEPVDDRQLLMGCWRFLSEKMRNNQSYTF